MTPFKPGATPKTPPGQGAVLSHLQASQMAHAAAKNASVAKMFTQGGAAGSAGAPPSAPPSTPAMGGTPPMPGPGSFKHQVMGMAKQKGMKNPTPAHVHAAIGALTNVGRFSPAVGAALQAHDGPLQGPGGDATMADISTAMPSMNPGA